MIVVLVGYKGRDVSVLVLNGNSLYDHDFHTYFARLYFNNLGVFLLWYRSFNLPVPGTIAVNIVLHHCTSKHK